MSRIDDSDRQAQRIAEKLALEKRQAEERAKKKADGESAFAKLVQQGQAQKGTAQQRAQQTQAQQQQQQPSRTREERAESGSIVGEAIAMAMEGDQKDAADRAKSKQAGRSFNDKLKQARAGEGERAGESRLGDAGRESMAAQGRTSDQRTGDVRAEARRDDARIDRQANEERGEANLKGAQGGGAARGKGDLKTDSDGGGKGQSGGGGKDQKSGGEMAAGFRFNPALMAPVPVAKPKDTGGSERLRQLANEIAQKIVERVRVGTNAAGAAEFQIDLRSNVLAGLSIKVSGGKGKIKLVFSGNDKEVLKLLGQQSEGLKQALVGRGLALEELRIEERA